ncbi:hypothetical protein DTO027I6_1652 [Penicillium roqueforti]|uniref:uncharacterized protein n=1 Tax=Penicillium roqueforti TaxID=5082 RepID=UPI00190DA7B4|nr:uncharacterized protein LCP9604111_2426 [Penicillium roqueforti]KAF9251025.1 hypothetical protein LCP9604111_2426 [Penicillium roqueforti]KAI2678807.1 hypothetical protein CBS147355_4692 [Penicillium roqueforti]KAI2718650.1 hypothetical protein CBS147318_3760 [Penicillium roqueforti]KAI2738010.1 hypothetical protein DTO013F2_9680 [Penicillium roqueforti]KAI3143160.1 hypothetical protein CBS147330_947 [Penicillium roqueforti]
MATNRKKVPSDQKKFYEKAGFYINSGAYVQRPEVIESFYYAHRYRDSVWNAFVAINATCRTDSGFAAVSNVNQANGGSKYDNKGELHFRQGLEVLVSRSF